MQTIALVLAGIVLYTMGSGWTWRLLRRRCETLRQHEIAREAAAFWPSYWAGRLLRIAARTLAAPLVATWRLAAGERKTP